MMLQLCGLSTVIRNRGSPVCNCGGRPEFSISRPPLPDRNFGHGGPFVSAWLMGFVSACG